MKIQSHDYVIVLVHYILVIVCIIYESYICIFHYYQFIEVKLITSTCMFERNVIVVVKVISQY